MNGIRKLALFLMLLSLTACASRVQRTVYYEYRPPVSHATVYTTVHRYQPIEVTVYADRFYRGGFSTIRLVMVDGAYAAIPIRNRTGQDRRIYAHYAAGVLHFDADRNCHGIQGASRFNHDNGWQQGRMYSKVSAGKNYDANGLKIKVRNVDRVNKSAVAGKDELRRDNDRNLHPQHADVDKHSPGRDGLAKGVQKPTVTTHYSSESRKDPAQPADHRVNRKSNETEEQVRARDRTPGSRSQAVYRSNREDDHEPRNDALAKRDKVADKKVDNEKNKAPQHGKLSRKESKQTVVQQTSAEHKSPHVKPNGERKPGKPHVDKANARHQADQKEKKPATEKKLVEKDRQGNKNKNRQDDDEQGDPDDEAEQGNGRSRHAI